VPYTNKIQVEGFLPPPVTIKKKREERVMDGMRLEALFA
jgi:hypothetical protein